MTGAQVTAIGDSVMLAAAQRLHAALPGIYIDAAVSRQMSAGLQTVARLAGSGLLRQVVVVGLGTNGTVTSAQIRQLRAQIGPGRWLVLVNTYEARPWQDEVNGALAAAAQRYPRVLLVNWQGAIAGRTGLLWDDDVHPRASGAALYARLIKAVVLTAGLEQRQAAGPGPGGPPPGGWVPGGWVPGAVWGPGEARIR
jgi:lysophospholipase L1-like esterase